MPTSRSRAHVTLVTLTLMLTTMLMTFTTEGAYMAESHVETLKSLYNPSHIRIHPRTGVASFAAFHSSPSPFSSLDELHAAANVLGLDAPQAELTPLAAPTLPPSLAHLEGATHGQVFRSLPVFSAHVRSTYANNKLSAFSSSLIPTHLLAAAAAREEAPVDKSALRIGREAAVNAALAHVEAQAGCASLLGQAEGPGVYALRHGDGHAGKMTPDDLHLAWRVRVGASCAGTSMQVAVSGHTGSVVETLSTSSHALYRTLSNETRGNVIWEEGDAPTLSGELNNTMYAARKTYDLFMNAFKVDSWDKMGAKMHTVYDDPRISCPNANWQGEGDAGRTAYCKGVASVDTVAHEWGHAYTQGGPADVHGLIYAWQAGALNEAYSDIVGQTVDHLFNLDLPSPFGPREVGLCSAYQTNRVVNGPKLFVRSPTGDPVLAALEFAFRESDSGFAFTNELLVNTSVALASPADGCAPLVSDVSGRVVVIQRGSCSFDDKAKNAQTAGAVGVIVANTEEGEMLTPGGVTVSVPVLMIDYSDAAILEGLVANVGPDVPVQLGLTPPPPRTDSYRWLAGAQDPAFNGAIRDLWHPPCFGHPGKVTDPEYHCSSTDNGGVHSNSGVANHMYALLVDSTHGEPYNGVVLDQLDLTVAFHVYWTAAYTYHTSVTDFADHEAALASACNDLKESGKPLSSLIDGSPTGPMVTAGDCALIAAAAGAVELSATPQCAFQPYLVPGEPVEACGATEPRNVIYQEGFATEPSGWTMSASGVTPTWEPVSWKYIPGELPEGRTGGYFGVDPRVGDCINADQSGRMVLSSPGIPIPESGPDEIMLQVRLDHLVATEGPFDGGLVYYSVNSGPTVRLGPEDYVFNAPPTKLIGAPVSGNPEGGSFAFSGVDGGSNTGSWASSVAVIPVSPGDVLNLHFVMSTDCGGGVDGWYLDGLTVSSCSPVCGDAICARGGGGENCASCAADCQCQCGFNFPDVLGVMDPVWGAGEEFVVSDLACSLPGVAAACSADCCGDGVCGMGEVCSVDCCGVLDDCSFEEDSGWFVQSTLSSEAHILELGSTYCGSGDSCLVFEGELDPSQSFIMEASAAVSTRFATPALPTSGRLSFVAYAVCALNNVPPFEVWINNAVRVWATEENDFPCHPTIDASFFANYTVELDMDVLGAGVWVVDESAQNVLTLNATVTQEIVLVDSIRLDLGIPGEGPSPPPAPVIVQGGGGKEGGRGGLIAAVVVLSLMLAGVGVGVAWFVWRRRGAGAAGFSPLSST